MKRLSIGDWARYITVLLHCVWAEVVPAVRRITRLYSCALSFRGLRYISCFSICIFLCEFCDIAKKNPQCWMGIADANKILHKNYMCSIEMYFCLFILDKTLITLGFKHVFFVWCHIKYGWKLDMTSSVNFRCFTRAVFIIFPSCVVKNRMARYCKNQCSLFKISPWWLPRLQKWPFCIVSLRQFPLKWLFCSLDVWDGSGALFADDLCDISDIMPSF